MNALAQTYLAAAWAYQGALLAAAALPRSRAPRSSPDGRLHLAVLVPAHDEEGGIAQAVGALRAAAYPADRRRVVVIADNCTDATAQEARAAGAEVWERDDPDHRGKGPALSWALGKLLDGGAPPDAVVFVDADCLASPNLLEALDDALAAGADVVQADYVVSNPDESPVAALRFAGFRLVNTLRPLGLSRLGLSAGLLGSGMAMRRAVLQAVPWSAFGVTEDREYHLELVANGYRVAFASEASVQSAMPTTHASAESQQLRWEAGNVALARAWVPRLVHEGVRARDVGRLHAAAAMLVAPQSGLAVAEVASLAVASVFGPREAVRRAAGLGAVHAAYVLGGLALLRAPRSVYAALPQAVPLVARKAGMLAGIAAGRRRPAGWERTAR
jgi:hypothetical protein